MAGTSPIERQEHGQGAHALRLTLKVAPHRWTFAFLRDDAPGILQRIEQLERDPDAPLDRAAADVLREQVLDLLDSTGCAGLQVGSPVVPSSPATPFITQTGKSPRPRCNDE